MAPPLWGHGLGAGDKWVHGSQRGECSSRGVDVAVGPAGEAPHCELCARNCPVPFSRTHFDSKTGAI